MEGGNPPDVVDYPQPGLMRSHIEKGYLAAAARRCRRRTSPTSPTAGTSTHPAPMAPSTACPVVRASSRWCGTARRCSPTAATTIPETLEDLTALSDQMVADGGTPWCIGAESGVATGWVLTDWIEDFMMRINGGEVYDQWINHEIPFNDPQVKAAVDAVGAFVKNPDYLGGENNVKAIATTKFQDGGLRSCTGDCLMHRQASFYVGSWPEGTTVAPDGDIWYFYLPSPAGGPKFMLGAGDIYAAATDKPESFDVVRYTGFARVPDGDRQHAQRARPEPDHRSRRDRGSVPEVGVRAAADRRSVPVRRLRPDARRRRCRYLLDGDHGVGDRWRHRHHARQHRGQLARQLITTN